jgi:hypothetical protein
MAKKDSRVDAYIAKAAPFAKPILTHIRSVVHAACPPVEEMGRHSPSPYRHGRRVDRRGKVAKLEVRAREALAFLRFRLVPKRIELFQPCRRNVDASFLRQLFDALESALELRIRFVERE